jgi:hypothetical protein
MTTRNSPQSAAPEPDAPVTSWQQRLRSASSLVEDLAADDDGVEELVALTGADTPPWVGELPIPARWQVMAVRDTDMVAPARIAVCGARPDGSWEATDTLEVYGYTGRPAFYDVLGCTARTLRDLDAPDITTRVLAIPATQGVTAERSTATVSIQGRAVWSQLTNYVAGSDEPHAGRLIVHNVHAATDRLPNLTEDITFLTQSVQDAFTGLFAPGS